MNEKQVQVIGECLDAAASGRFFEDWEFQTLFGLERAEFAFIAAAWPHVNQKGESVNLTIHNSFVNLIGFPIDRRNCPAISRCRAKNCETSLTSGAARRYPEAYCEGA